MWMQRSSTEVSDCLAVTCDWLWQQHEISVATCTTPLQLLGSNTLQIQALDCLAVTQCKHFSLLDGTQRMALALLASAHRHV
jgi:hypothetical protein